MCMILDDEELKDIELLLDEYNIMIEDMICGTDVDKNKLESVTTRLAGSVPSLIETLNLYKFRVKSLENNFPKTEEEPESNRWE